MLPPLETETLLSAQSPGSKSQESAFLLPLFSLTLPRFSPHHVTILIRKRGRASFPKLNLHSLSSRLCASQSVPEVAQRSGGHTGAPFPTTTPKPTQCTFCSQNKTYEEIGDPISANKKFLWVSCFVKMLCPLCIAHLFKKENTCPVLSLDLLSKIFKESLCVCFVIPEPMRTGHTLYH